LPSIINIKSSENNEFDNINVTMNRIIKIPINSDEYQFRDLLFKNKIEFGLSIKAYYKFWKLKALNLNNQEYYF